MSKTNADRKYCNTYFFKEIDKIFKSNGNPKWTSSDARALLGIGVHISSISNWIAGKYLPTEDVIMKFASVVDKDVDYVRGKMIQDYVRINGSLPTRNCYRIAKEVVECANNAYINDGSTDRVMIDDNDMYRKLHCGPHSPGTIEAVIVEGEKTETEEGMSLQEFLDQENKKLAENIKNYKDDVVPIKDVVKGTIFDREEPNPVDDLLGWSKTIDDHKKIGDTVVTYNGVRYGAQVCVDSNNNLIHGSMYDRYIDELVENVKITDINKFIYGKVTYDEFKMFDRIPSTIMCGLIKTIIKTMAAEIKETDKEN